MSVVEIVVGGRGAIYKEFVALIEQANKDRATDADVRKLRDFLDENEEKNLWRQVDGVCTAAERSLLGSESLPAGVRECWRRRMAALRDELGHKDAPQMEKLLIEHAVVCWLRLNLIEMFNAQVLNQNITFQKAMFWEKRLVTAQQRFTRAVETLAKVRMMTAATRLIESRTEAKRVGSLRLMKATEAA